jgi:hypothetical protein
MAQIVPTILSDITPEAFRKLVEERGFTNTMELAAFCGARDDTVRRWVSGKKGVPRSVAMLLGLMQHHKHSIADVYEITGEGSRP